ARAHRLTPRQKASLDLNCLIRGFNTLVPTINGSTCPLIINTGTSNLNPYISITMSSTPRGLVCLPPQPTKTISTGVGDSPSNTPASLRRGTTSALSVVAMDPVSNIPCTSTLPCTKTDA